MPTPPDSVIDLLRCPVCQGPLTFEAVPAAGAPDPAGFGVVHCRRHRFPVVDGIPVLMSGRLAAYDQIGTAGAAPGPTVDEALRRVEAGDGLAVLVDLLSLPRLLPRRLRRDWRVRDRVGRLPGVDAARRLRHRRVRRMLADSDHLTAGEWLDLFYRCSDQNPELYDHFLGRFGQPRDLAVLSLLDVLPADDRPVLDLACGFGHVSHHLVRQRPTRPVIGMDRTFYIVWVASRYVAPGAWFACADADTELPLASREFGAAVCVDAFHYLTHKQLVAGELQRVTGDGPVVLARCGNRLVPPNEGSELAPDEYAALFGARPVASIDEDSLVDRYLQGLGPDLATATSQHRSAGAAWISIVAGDPALTDREGLSDIPHARGSLGPNPVYRRRRDADGRLHLSFRFPSPWYAAENARMSEYCRSEALVDPEGLGSLDGDDPLVRGFAVIGLPERYVDWRVDRRG